jgi:hypothetical protein
MRRLHRTTELSVLTSKQDAFCCSPTSLPGRGPCSSLDTSHRSKTDLDARGRVKKVSPDPPFYDLPGRLTHQVRDGRRQDPGADLGARERLLVDEEMVDAKALQLERRRGTSRACPDYDNVAVLHILQILLDL